MNYINDSSNLFGLKAISGNNQKIELNLRKSFQKSVILAFLLLIHANINQLGSSFLDDIKCVRREENGPSFDEESIQPESLKPWMNKTTEDRRSNRALIFDNNTNETPSSTLTMENDSSTLKFLNILEKINENQEKKTSYYNSIVNESSMSPTSNAVNSRSDLTESIIKNDQKRKSHQSHYLPQSAYPSGMTYKANQEGIARASKSGVEKRIVDSGQKQSRSHLQDQTDPSSRQSSLTGADGTTGQGSDCNSVMNLGQLLETHQPSPNEIIYECSNEWTENQTPELREKEGFHLFNSCLKENLVMQSWGFEPQSTAGKSNLRYKIIPSEGGTKGRTGNQNSESNESELNQRLAAETNRADFKLKCQKKLFDEGDEDDEIEANSQPPHQDKAQVAESREINIFKTGVHPGAMQKQYLRTEIPNNNYNGVDSWRENTKNKQNRYEFQAEDFNKELKNFEFGVVSQKTDEFNNNLPGVGREDDPEEQPGESAVIVIPHINNSHQ